MKKSNIYILITLLSNFFGFSLTISQIVRSDSSFWDASLPELKNYKVYYLKTLENLQEEKRMLIERGIEDGERILQREPDRNIVDDILIRLADLYYFKEKDDYLDQMEQYNREFDRSMQDPSFPVGEQPSLDFSHTFSLYQRIVNEFPESDKVDDAIYNIGFLYEEQGNPDRAHQFYLHLINKYPESDYIVEAYMRLGEYFFNPPRNDINRAITYYNKVLKERQSTHYNEALYKLGWSYYRLEKYPEAISYFTNLVENLTYRKILQNESDGASVDLFDEALEYIAVCFMDFGGLVDILDYLHKINNPAWGEQVLDEFGDIYFKKREEYGKAINTYNALLAYNPDSPQAPVIQKKIVNCYSALGDEKQAYLSRKKLFETYSLESTWWERMGQIDALETAYNLAEEALRTNINYILQRANEKQSLELYKSVVALSDTYLKKFSEHVNAYMIRWNIALILDTRMHAYEEALKEYMTISMVYDTPKYRDYVRKKGLSTIKDAAKNAVVVADSLVQQEKKENKGIILTNANYISEIPLTKAESLLIMACDNYIKLFPFDVNTPTVLANVGALYYLHRKYNEAIRYYKTLTKYFPESDQIYVVQLSITKSYLGKKDYKSAEALASRLLNQNIPADIKQKVRELYGQAIFLNAQHLAKSNNADKAAAEFYRMAMEVPLLEFADRALFNSGREYEKINNLERAIRSYNQLIISYNSSNLYIDALNNLAFDYADVGDFNKSAEKYEELAELITDSSEVENAFYLAHTNYVKSENWQKAIETGEKWITQYPGAQQTPDINFELADYYYKTADYQKTVQIYKSYPDLYPTSPLGVNSYYRLGEIFLEQGRKRKAEESFYHAYQKNEDLKAKGFDAHDYFAAEGLFRATRLMQDRYENITISGSGSDSNLRHKQTLLDSLLLQYQQVVQYKSERLPESLYRLGEIYEQFGQTLRGQQLPVLSAEQRAVKRNEILFQCERAYQQALHNYSKAIPVLRKIESQIDSINWLSMIENKVSEMLYYQAAVNKQAIDNLLNVPIPAELEGLEMLEYKKQLYVTTIRPLVVKAIAFHKRNIFLSDSLHLTNAWMDSSAKQVRSLVDFLPQKFINLSYEGLAEFRHEAQNFRSNYLLNKKQPDIDKINNLVNLIESSELYAKLVIELYLNGIQSLADYSFIPWENVPLQNRLINFSLSISDTIDYFREEAEENKQQANHLFSTTNDFIYESCLTAFEDNIYFLKQFEINVLETVYQSFKDQKERYKALDRIALKLIKCEPEVFSKKLSIPLTRITLIPDTTWKASSIYYENWEAPDFSAKTWKYLKKNNPGNTIISDTDTTKNNLYLRKLINLPGFPVNGHLEMSSQTILAVYINGERIRNTENEDFIIITPYLTQGSNSISLKVLNNIDFKLEDLIEISYIPKSELSIDENRNDV